MEEVPTLLQCISCVHIWHAQKLQAASQPEAVESYQADWLRKLHEHENSPFAVNSSKHMETVHSGNIKHISHSHYEITTDYLNLINIFLSI